MSRRERALFRPGRQERKKIRKFLSNWLTGFGSWLVRFISNTLRVRTVDEHHFFDTHGGRILCMWHGRAIPPTARMRGVDLSILISLSRDGEVINQVLSGMGFSAVRGSSGPHGARVLASCIKMLRAGQTLVVTPDGPRGPSGVLQGGVVTMAKKSGCSLIPIGCSSRPRFVMNSWDRFELPLPFARSVIVFGEPMTVPEDADEDELERLRAELQKEMRRLQDAADAQLGQKTFAQMSEAANSR